MADFWVVLALVRVVVLIQQDRGPLEILRTLRLLLRLTTLQAHPPEAPQEMWNENPVADLFSCYWCLSLWLGVVACFWLERPAWYALAYSGATSLVLLGKDYVGSHH
jgi:hypothetical protein